MASSRMHLATTCFFLNVWGLLLAALVLLPGTLPGPVFDAAVNASSQLMAR